jgi:hypothetical protein
MVTLFRLDVGSRTAASAAVEPGRPRCCLTRSTDAFDAYNFDDADRRGLAPDENPWPLSDGAGVNEDVSEVSPGSVKDTEREGLFNVASVLGL